MPVSTGLNWGQSIFTESAVRDTYYSSVDGITRTGTGSFRYGEKLRTLPATPASMDSDGWRHHAPYSCTVIDVRNVKRASKWTTATRRDFYYPVPSDISAQVSWSTAAVADRLPALQARAITDALSRLQDSKADIGVAIGEARETLSHLAETSIRLFRLIKAMRRGNFSEAADILGLKLSKRKRFNLAKNWLEYSFAWRPLVKDVFDVYNLAQHGLDKPLRLVGVRDVRELIPVKLNRRVYDQVTGGYIYSALKPVEVDFQLGVKVTLHARVSNPELNRLKQFGLGDPASILWELVPWSFLIDWAVPVGTFLSACTANQGLSFVDGCRSEYLNFTGEIEDAGVSGSHRVASPPYEMGAWRLGYHRSRRVIYSDFPRPVLYGNSYLSTNKVVTAAALWHTVRR